jgi:hypothetical protein
MLASGTGTSSTYEIQEVPVVLGLVYLYRLRPNLSRRRASCTCASRYVLATYTTRACGVYTEAATSPNFNCQNALDHPLVLHDSELDWIPVDIQTEQHVSGSCQDCRPVMEHGTPPQIIQLPINHYNT